MNDDSVHIACPQCGMMVEVPDPTALVLALHQQNDCDVSPLLIHHEATE